MERLADGCTVFLEISGDIESGKRFFNDARVALGGVQLQSSRPGSDREGVAAGYVIEPGKIETIEAVRAIAVCDAISDVQDVVVSGHVQVGGVCIKNLGTV